MDQQTQPLNIILLGDPAAGKATHGEFLAKKFKLYDLDMGRELRSLEHNHKLRKKYRLDKTLDSGKLTPTELVRNLLHDKIHSTSKNQGILFNGTPKMIGEAKLVAKWLRQEKRENVLFILSIYSAKRNYEADDRAQNLFSRQIFQTAGRQQQSLKKPYRLL